MGTWGIGGFSNPDPSRDAQAVEAVRRGLELGLALIDTAEMYGRGHTEEVVAEIIAGIREQVFLATKVSADNLSYHSVLKACDASLKRLGTSYIDLYQIHWPNKRYPISKTMRAMERLVREGKGRFIGVSNFSVAETREAQEALSKTDLASNQVEYSILDREIEADLLPYCQRRRITVIAYTPIAKARILRGTAAHILGEFAMKYGKTPVQVALNWLITKSNVVAIPKASNVVHVEENAEAVGWRMTKEDYVKLGESFQSASD